jgi:FKBP-type peptidyl-prolyl cis-trans isomerase
MKKIFIVMALVVAGFAACKSGATGGSTDQENRTGKRIRTQNDSLSYAIGVDVGNHLRNLTTQLGGDLDMNMVLAAVRDVQNDRFTLTHEQSIRFLEQYFSMVLPQRQLERERDFLDKISRRPGINITESGLMYEIERPGNDARASLDDRVRVMYRGTFQDGNEFDSSYAPGRDTTEFMLRQVVRGWGEGLQLIGEGGKIRLWVPSELGYGQWGSGPVGPNQPLVFEVELFEIIPAEVMEE